MVKPADTEFLQALRRLFPALHKVCIITTCFPPYPKSAFSIAIGGVARKYERIVADLKSEEIEFCVISDYYEKTSKDQSDSHVNRIGVYHPYTLSNIRNLYPLLEFFNPSLFIKVLGTLIKQRPDVVIIGDSLQLSMAPIVAAKVLGIEVIIQHDWLCPLFPRGKACDFIWRLSNCGDCLEGDLMPKPGKLGKFLFGAFSAFMLPIKRNLWNMCQVFAEGSYFRTVYVDSGIDSKKISIVPPSPTVANVAQFDTDFFNELQGLLRNANVIVYVGRLAQEKGIELLIQSYKLLKSMTKRDVKLAIAGDGPLRDLVAAEAKRESGIFYLGWLPKEKLVPLYLSADLVIISSIYPEAYPNVAVEALSLGKRVIAFSMGGMKEIAKKYKSVTLVEKVDSASLAEAIVKQYSVR